MVHPPSRLAIEIKKLPFLLKNELQYYNAYVHESSLFLRNMRQETECPSVCVQNLTESEYCLLVLRLVSASPLPRLSVEIMSLMLASKPSLLPVLPLR